MRLLVVGRNLARALCRAQTSRMAVISSVVVSGLTTRTSSILVRAMALARALTGPSTGRPRMAERRLMMSSSRNPTSL